MFRCIIILALIALFAIHPILVSMLAGFIARAAGCRLDEGDIHPCVIAGRDYGAVLYDMGTYLWAMIFTFFAAEAALVIVLATYVIRRLLRKRDKRNV
jgi:hypothetical protein